MADYDRQRRILDRTELGASLTAGTIGAGYGAAKLRDAYKADPKYGEAKFERHAARAERAARRVAPGHAPTFGRLIRTATPANRFRPLAAAAVAGGVAAGAGRYEGHVKRKQAAERRRQQAVAKRGPLSALVARQLG